MTDNLAELTRLARENEQLRELLNDWLVYTPCREETAELRERTVEVLYLRGRPS